MGNNIFVFSSEKKIIEFERFHLCTWEFKDNSAVMEIGGEIRRSDLIDGTIKFSLYIPWIKKNDMIKDLFSKLIIPEYCKLIFNEPTPKKTPVNEARKESGQIMEFPNKKICIFPINPEIRDKFIDITLDANYFLNNIADKNINIYFRFYLKTNSNNISIRKGGINLTTIIYEFKINEKRNIPQKTINIEKITLCTINKCFLLNIIPYSYNILFYDNNILINIRTLEYESFINYIDNIKIIKNDHMVIFNKVSNLNGYTFFTKLQKERISPGQIVFAIWINIFCQSLLFSISLLSKNGKNYIIFSILITTSILLFGSLYIFWPKIKNFCHL